ncbi:MAG: hypothetical protein ABIW82_18160 [Dokdonella sp.]
MNRVSRKVVIAALVFGAAYVAQGSAQSSGAPYDIKSVVIAGGGSPIAGGSYQISSTLGQPATSTLSGAGFVIVDGFWAPVGALLGDSIFANGFESP